MKKQRREKKQLTDEEMSRAADARLRRHIANAAIEWAKREPDVQRQMVEQTFGYRIPDQIEKAHNELHAFIDNLAIKMLKEDSEFARSIAEARIRQVAEEMGLSIEGRKVRPKPLTIDGMVDLARKYQELKEAFGVKEPGFWESLMDPQVITSILAIIGQVFTKQPPAENNIRIMVQESGINRLVTMEEFKQMTGREPVAYIGDEEPPETDNEAKSNDQASEMETQEKSEAGDGETGTAGPGN